MSEKDAKEFVSSDLFRTDLIKRLKTNHYIFSVSEVANGAGLYNYQSSLTCDDITLFSYYAKGHTGFAIELETRHLPQSFLQYCSRVLYTDVYPRIDMSCTQEEVDHKLVEIISTKHRNWSNEKEWRFVLDAGNLEKIDLNIKSKGKGIICDIPKKAISSVILGCKMCEQDIQTIIEIIKDTHIRIYKTHEHNTKYQLDLELIKNY
ncbi:DUF2971 domain-containing protein [Candidatus Uabimicrobium sp. HlEnr_7]|uniref:DUF2971 domain-containing protein n=1 Tax=Candidatus Uabimicrobium helgolandensis TaxID=3095367 RepID=UPI003557D323